MRKCTKIRWLLVGPGTIGLTFAPLWWHLNCTNARYLKARTVHNALRSPNNGVRDILDRVLSSYEEIDGRFASVGGLGPLLTLYEQLQRELERVSYEEIDRMTAEIRMIIEALLKVDYDLRRVNNLKLAFDARQPTVGSGER
jgi:hypothetical protein